MTEWVLLQKLKWHHQTYNQVHMSWDVWNKWCIIVDFISGSKYAEYFIFPSRGLWRVLDVQKSFDHSVKISREYFCTISCMICVIIWKLLDMKRCIFILSKWDAQLSICWYIEKPQFNLNIVIPLLILIRFSRWIEKPNLDILRIEIC